MIVAFPNRHCNHRKGWRTTLRTEARQTPGRATPGRWVVSDQGAACLPCVSCGTGELHQGCHVAIYTVKEADSSMIWQDAMAKQGPRSCGVPWPDGEAGATQPQTSTVPCTPWCHRATESAPKTGPGHQHFITGLLRRSDIQWQRNYLNKQPNLYHFSHHLFFFFFLIFVVFPTCRSLQPFCRFKTLFYNTPPCSGVSLSSMAVQAQ